MRVLQAILVAALIIITPFTAAAADPLATGATTVDLTPEAKELARELEIYDLLNDLERLKINAATAASSGNQMDSLLARQDLLEAKQKYQKRILKASLEVDYVLAAIGSEQHRYEQMSSDLQNTRDSAVMLTNIAAQVSNGALWILSCSYTLKSRTNPKFDFGDGVNGILAGAVPSLLSLYALYQLKGKAANLEARPNLLAPLLGTGHDAGEYFPKSVLEYLNAAPVGQTVSRRQQLIDTWIAGKKISQATSKNYDRSTRLISGTVSEKRALTISLLDKQMTMLGDLRAVIFGMKKGLLELMPVLD